MTMSLFQRFSSIAKQSIWAGVGIVLFSGALWVLHRELAGVHFSEVVERFRVLPWQGIVLALGFTISSYAVLAGYDWLALRHIGRRLPIIKVEVTSFIATAIGHNLGVAMLSGGAVRYRLYSAAGLSAEQIATVIGMIGLTFGLGVTLHWTWRSPRLCCMYCCQLISGSPIISCSPSMCWLSSRAF